jgi:hypothetical protein
MQFDIGWYVTATEDWHESSTQQLDSLELYVTKQNRSNGSCQSTCVSGTNSDALVKTGDVKNGTKSINESNRIEFVLIGMQNRTLDPNR